LGQPLPTVPTVGYISGTPNQTMSQANSQSSRSSNPMCPRCGSGMVRRTAHQGLNAGRSFWGCSRFPQCRGTRN
jgi:restriction system protein